MNTFTATRICAVHHAYRLYLAGDRVLRPFSLHLALGQALLHGAELPAAAATVLTSGLNRRLLSRLTGAGSTGGAAGGAAGAGVFAGTL